MKRDDKFLSRDRMRFNPNKTSATLTYIAILFNVFYFVNIYSSNFDYYYTTTMGLSVVYNLMFLLIAFLCSEGVKNYNAGYAFVLCGIGIMQIVRIFNLPLDAYRALTDIGEPVMATSQFVWVTIFLVASAICAISAGVIGISKTVVLRNHMKKLQKTN